MNDFFKHWELFVFCVVSFFAILWAMPYLVPLYQEIREEYTVLSFIWAIIVGVSLAFWEDPLKAALVVFVIFPGLIYFAYGFFKYVVLQHEP